jgi:1,4-alpha-glucan branching enzyme
MLYRDYSRREGQWRPNKFGGRENLEAIDFLKRLNAVISERVPGATTIAEESTAWPGVSTSLTDGGLGFSYKWNMGWMHDTLNYMGKDPAHRKWHHNEFTFSMIYAYSEHYVLPLSHDEVVHGKRSLYGRMPGDAWQKLANLRCYFTFMWTHPGKKLLFMGGEIGQDREWSHDSEVDWGILENTGHAGLQQFVRDLNRLYVTSPQLYAQDDNPSGFSWVIGDDADNSVFSYARHAPGMPSHLVVLNMTPVPRHDYRIGVERPGRWRELLNSDAALYGGSNIGNAGQVQTDAIPAHGQDFSLTLTLPPLGAMIFAPED